VPPKESAGLILYRWRRGEVEPATLEVLLGHPGGPFWATRHNGAWTIPKGGIDPGEVPLQTAIREFVEETGFRPCGPYLPLGHVTQRGGKIVHAWAFQGDCDPSQLTSVMMSTEWPPRSGRRIEIPEIDRVAFYSIDDGKRVINVAQAELLDRLVVAVRRPEL
jgi:predicted NUDIX family NTP pyrophosphohydrolase